jgi:hypothetical protein
MPVTCYESKSDHARTSHVWDRECSVCTIYSWERFTLLYVCTMHVIIEDPSIIVTNFICCPLMNAYFNFFSNVTGGGERPYSAFYLISIKGFMFWFLFVSVDFSRRKSIRNNLHTRRLMWSRQLKGHHQATGTFIRALTLSVTTSVASQPCITGQIKLWA